MEREPDEEGVKHLLRYLGEHGSVSTRDGHFELDTLFIIEEAVQRKLVAKEFSDENTFSLRLTTHGLLEFWEADESEFLRCCPVSE